MKRLLSCFYNLLLILLLSGCIDKDFTNITDNTYYTPEYSLPIGDYNFNMQSVVSEYGGSLFPIIYTDTIPDSILVLNYDSAFYNSPHYFYSNSVYSFSFNTITENIDYITSFMLRLNCINKIPARISVQVYLCNFLNIPVDSVYKDGWLTIDAAVVNDDGSLRQAVESFKNDTELDANTINLLPSIYSVIVQSRLEIENFSETNIRYLSTQNFWSELAFRIGLEIPLNEI